MPIVFQHFPSVACLCFPIGKDDRHNYDDEVDYEGDDENDDYDKEEEDDDDREMMKKTMKKTMNKTMKMKKKKMMPMKKGRRNLKLPPILPTLPPPTSACNSRILFEDDTIQ